MMRPYTPDREEASHAGRHGDFAIVWPADLDTKFAGWYAELDCSEGKIFGPFATSQAAFGAVMAAIDGLIIDQMKGAISDGR